MKLYPWHSKSWTRSTGHSSDFQRPAQWGDLAGALFEASMASDEGAYIEIDGTPSPGLVVQGTCQEEPSSFFRTLEQVTRAIERRAANVNLELIPDPTVVLPRRIFDQIIAASFGVPTDILYSERSPGSSMLITEQERTNP